MDELNNREKAILDTYISLYESVLLRMGNYSIQHMDSNSRNNNIMNNRINNRNRNRVFNNNQNNNQNNNNNENNNQNNNTFIFNTVLSIFNNELQMIRNSINSLLETNRNRNRNRNRNHTFNSNTNTNINTNTNRHSYLFNTNLRNHNNRYLNNHHSSLFNPNSLNFIEEVEFSIPLSTTNRSNNTFLTDLSNNFTNNILNIIRSFNNPVVVAPSAHQIEQSTRRVRFGDIEEPINTTCPISLERFNNDQTVTQIIHCNHNFNTDEINTWFQSNVRCPVCRYDIREYRESNSVMDTFNLDRNINSSNLQRRFI